MEVILTKDVQRIGCVGQVVNVKDGFARNFLFPNSLAVPMNAANQQKLEIEKKKRALELEKLKQGAEGLKAKIAAVSLTLPVLVQEDGKFYGSISTQDICRALKEEGIDVDKHAINLADPIKALGIYEVEVTLHPEVTAKLKIWIVKK